MFSYVDYNLKVGDFITKSGYTVILDSENNIKQINDNTISNNDTVDIMKKESSNEYKVSYEDKEYYINKAKENISNKEDILKEEILFYYDIEQNKKSAHVTLEIKDKVLGSKKETFIFDM